MASLFASTKSTIMTTNSELLPAPTSLSKRKNILVTTSDASIQRELRKPFKGIRPSRSLAGEQGRPFGWLRTSTGLRNALHSWLVITKSSSWCGNRVDTWRSKLPIALKEIENQLTTSLKSRRISPRYGRNVKVVPTLGWSRTPSRRG